MVSNYKRKTERGSYSKDKLKEAVQAVKNGNLSGYKASQLYEIPRMTIMDRVNNRRLKSNSLGRNTALTPEAEAKLANSLKLMEKNGFGLSRNELLEMVGEYVQKNNISTNFKNRIPGQAWFTAFKNRHNLSLKKPQAVEYARKKAIDPFIVYPYFSLLKNVLEELKLSEKPEAIWNMDETSFSKDPEKTKIVGAKGHAATRVISSPGRENTTVLLCGNARGDKAPPMIVYKGKNVWDSWVSPDAYPNTSYAATANGWMESDIFEKYFLKTFLPAIGHQRPILLIYDGHATHVSLNIIERAREAEVTILKLPAHTSHILQPLDISLMKPFKDRWDALLVKWQRLNVGVPLPKREFARLIGEVWKQVDGQILKNGFRKAGIFPHNVDEIGVNNFDLLKLQRWRKHSETIATEISDKIVAKNTPKSLLSLALDCILRETDVASVECEHAGHNSTLNGRGLDCSNTLNKIDPKGLSQLEYEEPKIIHQVQGKLSSFAWNKDSAKNPESTGPKIQILENKLVSFEDLLLMKVKAGNNETVKRRKMAPGAEVITHDDVLKRKIEEKVKNIKKETQTKKKGIGKKSRVCEKENKEISTKRTEVITQDDTLKRKIEEKVKNIKKETQTKKGKGIGKKNRDIEKENEEINTNKLKVKKKKRAEIISQDSTSVSDCLSIHSDSDNIFDCDKHIFKENEEINSNKLKVKKKKRAKIISPDSTSVSGCLSIHSDSDIFDCDENIFIDTNIVTPMQMVEKENNIKEAEMWEVDPLYYGPSTSKRCFAVKKREFSAATKKGNGIEKGIRKKNIDTRNIFIDTKTVFLTTTENKKESNEVCNSSDRENEVAMEDSNSPDSGNEMENTEKENNLAINDHVLVRYFNRKKWTYYVGYVEGIKKGEEVCYTIRFYKTVKSPLKFVLTKRVDCDDVPIHSIVKKVNLEQAPNNPKEFVLSDNDDMIYFSCHYNLAK